MVRTPSFSALTYLVKGRVGRGRAANSLKVCGVWEKLSTTHFPSCKQIYHFQIYKVSNIASPLGFFLWLFQMEIMVLGVVFILNYKTLLINSRFLKKSN